MTLPQSFTGPEPRPFDRVTVRERASLAIVPEATLAPDLALATDHARIVTDRLHFAIAGLHMGRDVTLVANDYHKNHAMHATWLAALGCRIAGSAAEACGRHARAA